MAQLNDTMIYGDLRVTGKIYGDSISATHTHPASAITAGTFDAARIPAHTATTTAYGAATTANYGHVKITSGNLNGKTYAAGEAAAAAHTHAQYASSSHNHSASEITAGTFAADRIPSLSASKITAGTFDAARIPNLSASKITAGTFDAARIPAHTATTTAYGAATTANYGHVKIVSGNLNGQSYAAGTAAAAAHTHAQYASSSHNHSASEITAGTFVADRIPGLNASKITAGTFDAARIPNLSASKITAGTFDAARIPNLSASKITAGTFDAARIPNLSASKITAGTFDTARIPAHASATTGYGAGTTANYGHVKILSGNMNGKTYAAGEAAAAAHTHSNYTTTDDKVKQNLTTANGEYPIILKLTTTASDSPTTATNYAAGVTVNPSAKSVSASAFIGNLSGTASATNLIVDSGNTTRKLALDYEHDIAKISPAATTSTSAHTKWIAGMYSSPSPTIAACDAKDITVGAIGGTGGEYMTMVHGPSTIGQHSPASACITYFENMPAVTGYSHLETVYNDSGKEYTILFSKSQGSSKIYGSVIRMGYTQCYPEILRNRGNTWSETEWNPVTPPQVLTLEWSDTNSKKKEIADFLYNAATIICGNNDDASLTRHPVVFLYKDWQYFMLTQQYGGSSSLSTTKIYKFTNAGIYGSDIPTEIKFTVVTDTSTQQSTYTWNIETSTRWKHVVGSIGTDPNTIYYT